jgi:hypothetical protein
MSPTLVESAVRVGPATVRALRNDRVILLTPSGETEAELALAYPYHPVPGDIVLTLAGEKVYVIGVLRGQGKTTLSMAGNVEIRAGGSLDLVAERAVTIRSPQVTLRADRLETVARAAFERFVDSYRWVKDLYQVAAGRSRLLVDGTTTVQAERIVERARQDVSIDGSRINLG